MSRLKKLLKQRSEELCNVTQEAKKICNNTCSNKCPADESVLDSLAQQYPDEPTEFQD